MTVVESKMVAAVAKINVLGVGIAGINLPMAASLVFDAIARHEKGYICVTDVHVVMQAQRDEAFRKVLNSAFLCTPDGMPIVWMSRLQGHPDVSRVYGSDLMQEVLQKSL